MNEDAQQEVCDDIKLQRNQINDYTYFLFQIYMFLRATEMNPTDMNLGGFFDVNRNLFKSVSIKQIIIN